MNENPLALFDQEPSDIGVLPPTEASYIIGDLYFGSKKTAFHPQMKILLKWVGQWESTSKELLILQYINKLWNEKRLSDLQIIADVATIEMLQNEPLVTA